MKYYVFSKKEKALLFMEKKVLLLPNSACFSLYSYCIIQDMRRGLNATVPTYKKEYKQNKEKVV